MGAGSTVGSTTVEIAAKVLDSCGSEVSEITEDVISLAVEEVALSEVSLRNEVRLA